MRLPALTFRAGGKEILGTRLVKKIMVAKAVLPNILAVQTRFVGVFDLFDQPPKNCLFPFLHLCPILVDCALLKALMNAEAIIRSIESEQIKDDLPIIYVGDTVRVGVRIVEGGKERVQPYEGTVIAMRNGGINETITVRRVFQGVGVERVFLIHAPRVATITVIRRGKARRAKLYYLRDRVGKATRLKQRFDRSL